MGGDEVVVEVVVVGSRCVVVVEVLFYII